MEGDGAALTFVRDLNLEAEEIAELPFERDEVGIGMLLRVPLASAGNPRAGTGPEPFAPSPLLGLPNRETLRDDLAGELGRIGRRRNGPRVAHADIALH